VWKYPHAVKVKRKGTARGRIITGVKKWIEEINVKEVKVIDGIQERRLRLEGPIWRIIMIYNNGSMKSRRKEIEDMLEDLEEEILCIGGILMIEFGRGTKDTRERGRETLEEF